VKTAHIIGVLLALGLVGAVGYLFGERAASAPAPVVSAPDAAPDSSKRASIAASEPSRRANAPAPNPRAPIPAALLPPVNTPVAGMLDDLKKQAAAGNNQAACRLSFELDRCHSIPRMQRSAMNFANLAREPGMSSELVRRYTAIAEREQAQAVEVQRLCLGTKREDTGEAWRYLLQAARAGHGPSMARYANRRTLWDEDPIRVLDGLIAFRAEGPAFLQGAAQMGYAEAYEQLGFSHINGSNLGLDIPVDRVKGLAYYVALMRTGTPEEVARLQRAIDYAMQKENLSQDDLAKARILAEPLAAALVRRNPAGSVDFTGGTFAGDNGSHCEK
jgi:TPR repeat protein